MNPHDEAVLIRERHTMLAADHVKPTCGDCDAGWIFDTSEDNVLRAKRCPACQI